jgi:hypothetical protein
MSKLSFDALAERADQVATEDLLNSINGGTENDCHPEPEKEETKEDSPTLGDLWDSFWGGVEKGLTTPR